MDTLEKFLQQEIAAKVVAALPEEQKQEIIAKSLTRMLLTDLHLDWEIGKLLTEQAMTLAAEYVKRPEIQEALRRKTYEAIEKILDGVVEAIAKKAEHAIKSNCVPLFDK
ncbi:hypothetical protein SAMN00808754_2063 [Thermanaeromonas toyohensis ToBE]|uniref:Uncharacterized protein n=1 Tax=Thermanaeromonas toyohensis ToBE TaxID=698762 RepID=A0A1W1VX83_9FIRM|nr:hypothetical protein [Thermanaeromonas toyohensis]SMB97992.1 hypothetical protein SAMN00808754_2063 [Thermanaeromonas toyohensis ToBE]